MSKEKRVNEDLRGRRIRLVGDKRGAIANMAELLNTPYRTYQDWELGNAATPGVVLVAIDALLWAKETGGRLRMACWAEGHEALVEIDGRKVCRRCGEEPQ